MVREIKSAESAGRTDSGAAAYPGIAQIIGEIRAYNPAANADVIARSYEFSRKRHAGQLRRSGEPYFSHPVAVARILMELELEDDCIVAALLHDTVEDTETELDEIRDRFGPAIATLVSGVTKVTSISRKTFRRATGDIDGAPAIGDVRQAENLRNLLTNSGDDGRALLIKLADRLHNMRTIRYIPRSQQIYKSVETLEIFAPLAERMGMQSWCQDLEDLAFAIIRPEERMSILKRFYNLRGPKRGLTKAARKAENFHRVLEEALEKAGIDFEAVEGRIKKPYSIWRKMQQRHVDFDTIFDVYGFRIIIGSDAVGEVYRTLGALHAIWPVVPGRFKDYISRPKANGYRALHTTVSVDGIGNVEIQIRTDMMHYTAERGFAAHWSYRDGVRVTTKYAKEPDEWLREIKNKSRGVIDTREFLELFKSQVDRNIIFCFTPKGKVIKLPRGATVLDFAYAVHTEVGHHAQGASVDGHEQDIFHSLRNGQTVRVFTVTEQFPKPSWQDNVKTPHARHLIHRFINRSEHLELVAKGRQHVEETFVRHGESATETYLADAARKLDFPDANAMLKSLAANLSDESYPKLERRNLTREAILEAAFPEKRRQRQSSAPVWTTETRKLIARPRSFERPAIMNCCKPVPGDMIVGVTGARDASGASAQALGAHAIDCPCLALPEAEARGWIALEWHKGEYAPVHEAAIYVALRNSAGNLGRICTMIGRQNSNISDLRFIRRDPDYFGMLIEIQVRDVHHLCNIIAAVRGDPDVRGVHRHRDAAAALTIDPATACSRSPAKAFQPS